MKAFAIRDEYADRNKDLAYLLYYEKEKRFHIEICADTSEWEAPMILSSFIRKDRRSVDSFWSGKWVEQRIVPPERQNLGMILKKHGLDEYDPYRLLIISHGRCAQDDCFITALKGTEYPLELQKMLGENIRELFTDEENAGFILKNGTILSAPLSELAQNNMRTQRLGVYRDMLKGAALRAGGSELCIDEDTVMTAEQLRSKSTVLPFTADMIERYMSESIIDTFTAAEMLGCTRQNVQDLVKRGRLKPFKSLKNNYLFLKNDIAEAADALKRSRIRCVTTVRKHSTI